MKKMFTKRTRFLFIIYQVPSGLLAFGRFGSKRFFVFATCFLLFCEGVSKLHGYAVDGGGYKGQ